MKLTELEALEKLSAKATPGPWVATKGGSVWRGPLQEDTRACTHGATREAGELFEANPFNYEDRARTEEGAERLARRDMQFIAAMRNALPELIKYTRAHLETHGTEEASQ